MTNVLEKITKVSIYLLVFLLPLWFLPWTSNILDFNKQTLLLFLVFISLFFWLLKSLIEGKITLNTGRFNIPIILFLLILGIGTYTSVYRYASFWGWPLSIAASFLTTFSFILLYFLILNVFQTREIFGLLFFLILSSFLAALFGGLQLFGKFTLPFDFTQISSFNTIGTVNSLGIFLAVLLPLLLSLIFITKRLSKFLLTLFAIISLGVLFVVNFWVAWIVLLAGSIVILVFGISRRESFKPNWLALPMVFLVIAIFFGVFRIGIPGLPATPLEISPSQKASLNIAKQTLQEKPFLGTGPGTFVYNYSKFKPETINQTAFWAVRFSAGASDILDRLSTSGILGFLSFVGILGFFFVLGLKKLTPKEKKELKEDTSSSRPIAGAREDEKIQIRSLPEEARLYEWLLGLGIFASWLGVVASFFLYPANISLLFLFWVLTACFIVLMKDKVKSWVLEPSSRGAILVSFLFILILVLGIAILFMEGQRYLAEARYQQGIEAWQREDDDGAINYLLSAIANTGGSQDNYWRDLSQVYLFRIAGELQKERSAEETSKVVSPLISDTVNSAKIASDIAPHSVANWIVRGFVYSQMVNILEGSAEWAIKSYEEALKLEPTNPYTYTELGRVYLAKGETEKAREQFQKALALKSDYAPARFQIALIYISENKTAQAIEEIEEAKRQSPFDVGVAFQLGVLYYNDNQFDKAKAEFERAVSLDGNYSNARYFLGLILDKGGKKKEAISQFEKIEVLNPDNEEVKKILVNLREGKPALEGITPAQPPIEQKPEEVLEK